MSDFLPPIQSNAQACWWMVAKTILATLGVVIAKYLLPHMHVFQFIFVVHLLSLPLFIPMLFTHRSRLFKTANMKLYGTRALLEIFAFSLSYFALMNITLPAHTAILYMGGIFTSIAAIYFLKEPNDRHRWTALLIGFVGVLIITRPGSEAMNWWSLLALLSAAGFAGCGITIKLLSRKEPAYRIVFYMMLLMTLVSFPLAFIYWQPIASEHWGLLAGMAMFSVIMQFVTTRSFTHVDVMVVMPFSFLTLLWSALAAYFWFDELINRYTLIGSGVIFFGIIYAIINARKKTAVLTAYRE